MKPLFVVFAQILLGLSSVAVPTIAAFAETAPAGCTARCKEQYLAITKYSDAFSRDAESAILQKAFGKPIDQAVAQGDRLRRYQGQNFDFFELLDSAEKEKLLGIFIKKNPAYARIPSLNMGEGKSGEPTKWYFTANDLTLGYILRRCLADFSGPYSGSDVLSPSCYFGKGGHYSYFAFQYSLVNQPCMKDIETIGLSEGLKKCPRNLPAKAVFIWDETVADDARELAEFFAAGK